MSRLAHSTTWTVWRATEGHIVTVPDTTPIPREVEVVGVGLWVQDAIDVATQHRDAPCQTSVCA